jgi:short-subunit dehydrogenase
MVEQLTYTLITGGSSGIGKALARECARRSYNLILVALDNPDLAKTADEIRKEFSVRVETIGIDLTDVDGPTRVFKWCLENGYRVNILINNAGIAGSEIFEESDLAYSDLRIMLNVRALVLMTQLFIPELKKHPEAYILNMGSMSAYYPIPYKSVYAASKAFVLSFSRALKVELKDTGIGLTVINPNGVRTNTGSHGRIDSHGKTASLVILPVERIAKMAIRGMLNGKRIIIPGGANKVLLFLSRLIPSGIREKRIAAIFRKELSKDQ